MAGLKYKVIKSRSQYNEYCRIIDRLLEANKLKKQQQEELQLLTVLLEKWDAEHNHFRDMDPVEIVRSLMNDHSLTASELTGILEISKSHVSDILNYKKGLSKEVIRKLSSYFKLNQEAFNRPYKLKSDDPDDSQTRKKTAASKNLVYASR